jgi:polyphosphate kinase 2
VELVKLQRSLIDQSRRLLVIFEGRDASGKDGVIKRFTAHLSPRDTRVVALGKPSERDRTSWYFQRYVEHLPAGGEFVLMNRSWYNRAGVERVMGFCSQPELTHFFETCPHFEQMLVSDGFEFYKYYLDISKAEQKKRMQARRDDPLKQWKISEIDAKAVALWDEYSTARNEMLARTHSPVSPWRVVRADDKRRARLGVIRDFLTATDYDDKDMAAVLPDRDTVFFFDESYLNDGVLAA